MLKVVLSTLTDLIPLYLDALEVIASLVLVMSKIVLSSLLVLMILSFDVLETIVTTLVIEMFKIALTVMVILAVSFVLKTLTLVLSDPVGFDLTN